MAMDKIPISKFSLMTRLTEKVLRLYDKKGILRPSEKNGLTGYRYYTISQVETGLRIKSLHMLGFNLEDIADFLNAYTENDEEKLQRLVQKRIQEIKNEKQKLAELEDFLLRRRKEVFEMIVEQPTRKKIPAMRVLSIRRKGSFDPTIHQLIVRICTTLERPENKKNVTVTGPIMTLCYDEEYKETDNDIECAIPISGQITLGDTDLEIKTLPTCTVMSILHKGSYKKIFEKYTVLFKHIEENGFTVSGPCRELYYNDPAVVPEAELQTEIQIPIKE
jgi:effector-binding domain-containing protein